MRQKSVQLPGCIEPIVAWESENWEQLQEALQTYATDFLEKEAAYVQANAKSAESVLALCKVAFDAFSHFAQLPKYLHQFRLKTNLKNKSTFSQHVTVGANYDRLMAQVQQLPSSWYTLYQIARLKPETYDKAVAAGKIHPRMTQRDVDVLAGRDEKSIADTRRFLQIEFSTKMPLVAADVVALQSALWDFLHAQPAPFNSGVSVAWSKPLKDAIQPPTPRKRGKRGNDKTIGAPVVTTPSKTEFEDLPKEVQEFFGAYQTAA